MCTEAELVEKDLDEQIRKQKADRLDAYHIPLLVFTSAVFAPPVLTASIALLWMFAALRSEEWK